MSNDTEITVPGQFSATLSNILAQTVEPSIPVLAKRKASSKNEKDPNIDTKKKSRKEKKDDKQVVAVDYAQEPYERQLKKLACRGVIALFNAIAKSKRDSSADTSTSASSSDRKHKPADVSDIKQMTKANLKGIKSAEKSDKRLVAMNDKKALFSDISMHAESMKIKDWDKDDSDSEDG